MAIISQATGRVATGFSYPYVAVYGNTGTTVTYTGAQELARGVDVSISPETSDANNFYANNIVAETEAGGFSGGTLSLTVDGLLRSAEALISGLTEPSTAGWMAIGDAQKPFCGVGYITRYRSGGATCYVPTLVPKVVFSQIGREAATQEEEIDWQTQSLEATLFRDDTEDAAWLYEGEEFATEAAALAALRTKLGVTVSG